MTHQLRVIEPWYEMIYIMVINKLQAWSGLVPIEPMQPYGTESTLA